MKCPQLLKDDHERSGYPVPIAPDCLEGDCAWYDEAAGRCAIVGISRTMTSIGNVLGRISDITPTEKQFRKWRR